MEKKKYITPALTVLAIDGETMMAGSDPVNTSNIEELKYGGNSSGGNGGDAKIPGSIWNFDDDDE